MMVAMLLAQASDPLSGGAGWFGAGLLGLVLCWLLLVHLPAKDKLILTIIESRDNALKEQRNQHSETIKKLGESINSTVERVTEHCKDELDEIATKFGVSIDKMEEAMTRVLTRYLGK